MTWELTKWGVVCKAVADFVTDPLEGYPQFSVGIGPDPDDLNEAAPRITFVAADDGEFDEPRFGGGHETHPTFDEEVPILVTIWAKFDLDTATNYDRSPALLESVVERFLEGCDALRENWPDPQNGKRHIAYLVPARHRRRGGRIGEYGSKSIIPCVVRIHYYRTTHALGTATALTMGLGVSGPDGNGGTVVDSFEVVGNAP